MGYREGLLAASLMVYIAGFVRSRNLGVVGAPDALMRLKKGNNRMPDISYTAWANLPSAKAHLGRVAEYPPDLAVEIHSPGNTRKEIERKRREYFAAGTKLVWEVDPDARTITVFTDPTAPKVLTMADTLDGGTVLPGFTLPIADLFNDPQLNPRP
jgi:Uma2 family endonuclease